MTHMQEDFAKGEGFSDSLPFQEPDDSPIELLPMRDQAAAVQLIRSSLAGFPEAGTVLAATFRRVENLPVHYSVEGAKFFVIRDPSRAVCIGAVGIGPMAGLPHSEGVGEIRDLVVDQTYRGRGLGRRLLEHCLAEAKALGYKRIYLETTPQMERARRLFVSHGFIPVQQKYSASSPQTNEGQFPCYFVLDLTVQRPEDLED